MDNLAWNAISRWFRDESIREELEGAAALVALLGWVVYVGG